MESPNFLTKVKDELEMYIGDIGPKQFLEIDGG